MENKAVILLLLLLAACGPTVKFGSTVFDVTLPKTPEDFQKGLMFVESMPDSEGMLFVFDKQSPKSFWMKNCFIPLDMVFIDENLTVVDIKHDFEPCKEDPCPHYVSKEPALYVLEINAGLAEKYGIKEGSKAELSE